jgi:hypothetical protein
MKITTLHIKNIIVIVLVVLVLHRPELMARNIIPAIVHENAYTEINTKAFDKKKVSEKTSSAASSFNVQTPDKFEFDAYPNPFVNTVRLDIKSGDKNLTSFRMYDIIGKEVLQIDLSQQKGTLQYTLNLSEIKPGIYFASINSDKGVVETRKFIKLS